MTLDLLIFVGSLAVSYTAIVIWQNIRNKRDKK